MAIDSETGTFLSWEEVQALQLPPNTTVLVPPPPPTDVTAPAAPPPQGAPEWLDDSYYAQPAKPIPVADKIVSAPSGPEDPKAAQAAREREEYGDPTLRLMTSLVATNAVLERIQSPPKKTDEEEKKKPR